MQQSPWARRQVVQAALAGTALLVAGCGGRQSAAPRSTGGVHYRVAAGDTLADIARRAGVSIISICDANGLRDGRLVEGQLLWLPGAGSMAPAQAAAPVCAAPKPAAPAASTGTPYRLVTRTQWGARSMRANNDPMARINRLTVHHTGVIAGMGPGRDVETVRRIQSMHQDDRGFADIGYHYIIGIDGAVYQGRPEHIQGAHAKGANNIGNLGVSLIGDFSGRMPSSAQMSTLQAVLRHQQQRLAIPMARVYGHRELGQTVCPGDRLFAWLERYRRGAA